MSDQPHDQPHEPDEQSAPDPAQRPPLAEQIRAKLEEYEVDRHLDELATTLEHAVRQGLQYAGEFAHEHRSDVARFLEKVASAVDTRTDGRHADTIEQVRGSLERGVDKIAEQRDGGSPHESGTQEDVPPSNG